MKTTAETGEWFLKRSTRYWFGLMLIDTFGLFFLEILLTKASLYVSLLCRLAIVGAAWKWLGPLEAVSPVENCHGILKGHARHPPRDIVTFFMLPLGATRLNALVKCLGVVYLAIVLTDVHTKMQQNNFKSQHYLGVMVCDTFSRWRSELRLCVSPTNEACAIDYRGHVFQVIDKRMYTQLVQDVGKLLASQESGSQESGSQEGGSHKSAPHITTQNQEPT